MGSEQTGEEGNVLYLTEGIFVWFGLNFIHDSHVSLADGICVCLRYVVYE